MAGARRGSGLLRFALACALLLLGLAAVVRRQSRGLELMRAVERARAERAQAEAERTDLIQRIEWLQSRARVTDAAGRRGMRLPTGTEIVILPELPSNPPSAGRPAVALR